MTNPQRRRAALPSPTLAPPAPTPFRADLGVACEGEDPEIFFEEILAPIAVAICSTCPARQACLSYALDNEQYGVWGGRTADERAAIRGGAVEASPEERQLVWLIHERVARGDLMPEIAAAADVNQRTLYRWLVSERSDAA